MRPVNIVWERWHGRPNTDSQKLKDGGRRTVLPAAAAGAEEDMANVASLGQRWLWWGRRKQKAEGEGGGGGSVTADFSPCGGDGG
jgi:hypothetical protein